MTYEALIAECVEVVDAMEEVLPRIVSTDSILITEDLRRKVEMSAYRKGWKC